MVKPAEEQLTLNLEDSRGQLHAEFCGNKVIKGANKWKQFMNCWSLMRVDSESKEQNKMHIIQVGLDSVIKSSFKLKTVWENGNKRFNFIVIAHKARRGSSV